jgi:hypothetical protein
MKKPTSMSAKVRRMIDQGHNNKTIVEKLGVKPQAVYNMRYQLNKARGLGALGKPAPTPTAGIGAPPKRTRKVKAGTGITAPEQYNVTTLNHQSVREQFGSVPALQGAEPYMPITMVEPKPTLWERVKGWFRG